MAKERGMTIDELNRLRRARSEYGRVHRRRSKTIGKRTRLRDRGAFILAFIPHSFKVLLICDPHEAARRIYEVKKARHEERDDEPLYASAEETERIIADRTKSDVTRYQKHYGIGYRDPKHFDLVLDTAHNKNPEETAQNSRCDQKITLRLCSF